MCPRTGRGRPTTRHHDLSTYGGDVVPTRALDAIAADAARGIDLRRLDAGQAVAEAARVLRPNGVLAVFDGNYSTTTVALGDHDPLQACVDAMMSGSLTDAWLMRRLPAIVRDRQLDVTRYASHGYVETSEAEYLLTVIDRGADMLEAAGRIGPELAAALKAEARRRAKTGAFFGQIVYTSLIARRPGSDR